MQNKKRIPIFYAADENYLPYLTVSISSLKENASKQFSYEVYVLNANMQSADVEKLMRYADDDFSIKLIDVCQQIEKIKHALQLRDYYTGATYYRVFIAGMFPQLDKALYLDSDTIVLGDISTLYNTDLGENLIGAVPDAAVATVPAFRAYTRETLGIEAEQYFNAGVILMNLAQFRKQNFYTKFCALLKEYKFRVAQDQDYLNVICKDKVTFLGGEWNKMPISGEDATPPALIHYNLTLKPWHYDTILYQEHFWAYAKRSEFYQDILNELHAYSDERKQKDADAEKALIQLCEEEIAREDNFIKQRRKAQ